MEITVRLFTHLRINRFKEATREYSNPVTVAGVIGDLGIQKDEVALILVNGSSAGFESELSDGDTLSLFPPVGGG